MRPAHRFWRSMGPLLCALLAVTCLLAGNAPAEPLEIGTPGPHFEKLETFIKEQHPDLELTGPLALIFIKEDDSFSARSIEQLKSLALRNEELFGKVRTVVVLTRINAEVKFDGDSLPKRWTLLEDKDDTYYTSYHVIATPTAVVVGTTGKVAGFHAGYSPGLVREIQRTLLMEVHGTDAVRTPAPATSPELQMGRRLADRGLWDRALPYYRTAVEKDPLEPPDLLGMARVLVEVGEKAEALVILEGLGDMEGAEELRQRAKCSDDVEPGVKAP